jgi:outer membrane lipoprotein-sorting protein
MREWRHGPGSPAGTRVSRVIVSFCFAALLLTVSCAQTQRVAPEAKVDQIVVSSTPPFPTKEPERYRATRTITAVSATGDTVVTRNRIARDGELRRDESESAGQRVVYLDLREGKFAVLPDAKLFADLTAADETASGDTEESESSPDRLLHTEPMATTYQSMGAESIGGRNTQKYRVVVNSSSGANVSRSETVIWIDDALQMPVKSETKSTGGARSTMELSDIALDVDPGLFRIPEGYEKITFAELRKRLKWD